MPAGTRTCFGSSWASCGPTVSTWRSPALIWTRSRPTWPIRAPGSPTPTTPPPPAPGGPGSRPGGPWLLGGRAPPSPPPPAPEVPVSRPGDTWLLGRHRLTCGDSTDPATVERALNGVRPHLMVTAPPYGVEYDPAWRNRAGLGSTQRVGKVENDDRADWREAWALFPGE